MANVKISNLTAATTPVAGTEVLPIVQSGSTVKVSIANLTPGLDTITAAKGGTGQTSYAVGDLLYASTTTALSKLADVATGNALISGGVSTAPSWGKIGLTTHVSGTLPTANGGTNLTSFTANGVVYASSSSVLTTGSALVFDGTNFSTTGTIKGATTIGVGNATPSTSGAGITFPATQSASSDANTLDDYEEGTWTPTDGSGAGLSLTVPNAVYIKIGQMVYVATRITFPTTASSAAVQINGLPFTTPSVTGGYWGGGLRYTDYTVFFTVGITPSATNFAFFKLGTLNVTNAEASGKTFDLVFMFRATA